MQAIYVRDQSVNILSAPNAWRDKCRPVLNAAGDVIDWIIPKGTVIDGGVVVIDKKSIPEPLYRVSTGQCAPFDEECAKACGQSADQLAVTQRHQLAAEKGIRGKKDLEMFAFGAIEGYGPGTTDDNPVYVRGPNWDAWEKAEKARREAIMKDTI